MAGCGGGLLADKGTVRHRRGADGSSPPLGTLRKVGCPEFSKMASVKTAVLGGTGSL